MRIVRCPECNQPARLTQTAHLDGLGVPEHRYLRLNCPDKHAVALHELLVMWTDSERHTDDSNSQDMHDTRGGFELTTELTSDCVAADDPNDRSASSCA